MTAVMGVEIQDPLASSLSSRVVGIGLLRELPEKRSIADNEREPGVFHELRADLRRFRRGKQHLAQPHSLSFGESLRFQNGGGARFGVTGAEVSTVRLQINHGVLDRLRFVAFERLDHLLGDQIAPLAPTTENVERRAVALPETFELGDFDEGIHFRRGRSRRFAAGVAKMRAALAP